jgi:hypothetical protein
MHEVVARIQQPFSADAFTSANDSRKISCSSEDGSFDHEGKWHKSQFDRTPATIDFSVDGFPAIEIGVSVWRLMLRDDKKGVG